MLHDHNRIEQSLEDRAAELNLCYRCKEAPVRPEGALYCADCFNGLVQEAIDAYRIEESQKNITSLTCFDVNLTF